MTQHSPLLTQFLQETDRLTVLTGAGVSTGSGIPDYRDDNGNSKVRRPIQYPEFVASAAIRQRYWARSFVGWQRFSKAQANAAHRALAHLEHGGKIDTLITQNVDGLHQQAGSSRIIELHGNLDQVVCTSCGVKESRRDYQQRLQSSNRDWHAEVFAMHPDGDADIAEANLADFVVPACRKCGGIPKPDVVMFGENVAKPRVAAAMASLQRSDALLVIGSSLMVFSGFRFAREAARLGKPVVILNRGKTRADELAAIKIEADCVEVLTSSVDAALPAQA